MGDDYYKTWMHWLVFSALTAIVVPLCMMYCDKPLAELGLRYVHHVVWLQRQTVRFPLMIILAVAALVLGAVFSMQRRRLPRWCEATFLGGIALIISFLLVGYILKPIFGRTPPGDYLHKGVYAFHWFGGKVREAAFPSGHAAQLGAVLATLWSYYPGLRWFLPFPFLVLSAALVISSWHFLSDVVVGGYVGAAIAFAVANLYASIAVAHPKPKN